MGCEPRLMLLRYGTRGFRHSTDNNNNNNSTLSCWMKKIAWAFMLNREFCVWRYIMVIWSTIIIFPCGIQLHRSSWQTENDAGKEWCVVFASYFFQFFIEIRMNEWLPLSESNYMKRNNQCSDSYTAQARRWPSSNELLSTVKMSEIWN